MPRWAINEISLCNNHLNALFLILLRLFLLRETTSPEYDKDI